MYFTLHCSLSQAAQLHSPVLTAIGLVNGNTASVLKVASCRLILSGY